MGLSGNVWPVHFPPFKDEALTSWLCRLAIYHHQVPFTFFQRTMPQRVDGWKQDLDVRCPEDIMVVVARKCCPLYTDIAAHTLSHWRNRFDPYAGTSSALPRWIVPACIRRDTVHHRGWRVCVMCLREYPYLKLFSRLLFYGVCIKHRLRVYDRCFRCSAAISSHRVHPDQFVDYSKDALAHCFRCGFDLRKAPMIAAEKDEIDLVGYCMTAMIKGYNQLGAETMQYSHLYFQGLRLVAKGLLRPRAKGLLTEVFCQNGRSIDTESEKHYEIEFLPVDAALSLLIASKWLLDDWPERFLVYNVRHGINYSDWVWPRDVAPYWFDSVVKVHRRKGNITSRIRNASWPGATYRSST